jgi:hypothetical protein
MDSHNIWVSRDLVTELFYCEVTAREDDTRVLHTTFDYDTEEAARAMANFWIAGQIGARAIS